MPVDETVEAAQHPAQLVRDPVGIGQLAIEPEGVIEPVVGDRPADRQAGFDLPRGIEADEPLRGGAQQGGIGLARDRRTGFDQAGGAADHADRDLILTAPLAAARQQQGACERDQDGALHLSFKVRLGCMFGALSCQPATRGATSVRLT